jgi:hypothetical protein
LKHGLHKVGLAAVLVHVLAEAVDHFDATFNALRGDLIRHWREKFVGKRLNDGRNGGAHFLGDLGFELIFLSAIPGMTQKVGWAQTRENLEKVQGTYGSMRGFIFSFNIGSTFSHADLPPLNAPEAAPFTMPCMILTMTCSALSLPMSGSPSMTSLSTLS